MDWTGVTNTPTFTIIFPKTLDIYGSLTLVTNMIGNLGQVNFEATTTGHTITTGGKSISASFNGLGGGWTLQDPFAGSIGLNAGSLDFNNQPVSASFDAVSNSFGGNTLTRSLTMGSSIITGSKWRVNSTGFTLDAGTSTIILSTISPISNNSFGNGFTYHNISFPFTPCTGACPTPVGGVGGNNNTYHDVSIGIDGGVSGDNVICNNVSFAKNGSISGNNSTFNNVTFAANGTVSGSGNTFNNISFPQNGSISGNNTFNSLTFAPGFTYTLGSGSIQTVNSLNATGNGGFPILITSGVNGNYATISKTSGGVCADFIRLRDIHAVGGAVFNAGLNGIDLGGNSGWNFNMPSIQYFADVDGDGYGITSNSQFSCAPSGIYTATVDGDCNDANTAIHPGATELCNGIDDNCNGSIDEQTGPLLGASATTGTILCFGGTATVTVTATGGTTPYTGTGAFTQSAGTHTYVVSDAHGCSASVTVTITQPAQLVATETHTTITCNGGTSTITIGATGGVAPYTGTGTFTRGPGTYIFIVTDARNCTATITAVVSAGFTVNLGPDKQVCNGSSATLTAAVTGAQTSGPAPPTPYSVGGTADQLIFTGHIDYVTIGNTMSQSEDRNNCNKNASSFKTLTIPAGAVIRAAYLYWSGSGSLDNAVSLNNVNVNAQNTKTFIRSGGFTYFGARADVTSQVQNSGNYTVSNLTWNNGSPYCFDNSAYGAWAMTIIYEQSALPSARIHLNTDKFQFTYPAGIYSTSINGISVPMGCTSNAKFTIVAFEGDNYKGEGLTIGGQSFGDNNFRGQSGPNLDILSWNIPTLVTSGTSSLTYSINAYESNTVFGLASEGLFDYVKVLKYNTCPVPCTSVSYLWSTGAATQSINVTQPGSYNVKVTDCSGCITRDTVIVTQCLPFDPAKCYKLIARNSGKALEIAGSSIANGGNAQQWAFADGNNQKWRIESVETDYYKLVNVNSVKVLEVTGSSTSAGANIQQLTWNGGNNQKWKLTKNSSNYYVVTAKHSGKVMEVAGSSTLNGGNVQQASTTTGNANNQQWAITEVGCPVVNSKPVTSIIIPEKDIIEAQFEIAVHPNPSTSYFDLVIKSNDKTPVTVRVLDLYGRVISVYQEISVNKTLKLSGDSWVNGTYFAEVIQGGQRKLVKMIKAN